MSRETCLTLENDLLTVRIYPERGGKTGSIQYRPTGFELLEQPKNGVYPPVTADMPFNFGDASGFDDVFPSMGNESIEWNGKTYNMPDHGEMWTTPMESVELREELILRCKTRVFPFRYEKRVHLEGDSIVYRYRIRNLSEEPLPFVWVCHCLMRWEDDVEFLFPEGLNTTQITRTRSRQPFSEMPIPREDGQSLKFYFTEKLSRGFCGAYYHRSGMHAEFTFDPEELPYLGFWITTGGYRGDWNFAFEPCTVFYDNIRNAQIYDSMRTILPASEQSFSLRLRLYPD